MFLQRTDHYDRNETLRKTRGLPLARAKEQTPPQKKASRQNHASQQGQQGRTCEKYRALATTAGQNPRNSHESQRGQQDTLSERRGGRHLQRQRSRPPAKPTRPPATATGRISRRRAAIIGARKARQGGRNTDTVRKTKKGPLKLLGGPF